MNKYDKYFNEIIEFVVKTNISSLEDFKGASDIEIENLEKEIDFGFETPLKTYLKKFGHKIGIQNFDLAKFTIKNILSAERKAEKDGFRSKIIKGKVLNFWDGTEYENELDKICFINYFEQNYHFTFINNEDDKCRLYSWESGDESFKYQSTISSKLRAQIHIGLKSICDARREKEKNNLPEYRFNWYTRTSKISIEEVKWLDVFRSNYISNNVFVTTRHKLKPMLNESSIKFSNKNERL